MRSGVSLINLSGANGINIIEAATGFVNLAAVSDTGTPAELKINAGTNITLNTVSIANLLDINLDIGTTDAATLNADALSAGTITVDGQSTNDTMNFAGTVTSTANGITISQAQTVDFDADVTGQIGVTVTNVNTDIDLAADVDVKATTGDVAMRSGVSLINLSGANGINIIAAATAFGNLAARSEPGKASELKVNARDDSALNH